LQIYTVAYIFLFSISTNGCGAKMDPESQIHRIIDTALEEDIRSGDILTNACIDETATANAKLILKQAGNVAGLPFLEIIFKKIDPRIIVELNVKEGSFQKAGAIIATLKGPMRGILTGERVGLNIIQHASGVATITAAYVKKIAGLNCTIIDTRKTLPGLRALEKYAVKVGGGINHRFGLDDRLVFKFNHINQLAANSKETIAEIIVRIKKTHPTLPIEIEIEELDKLKAVLEAEADAIMLINKTPEEIRKAVKIIRKTKKRIYVESGGAITLDTVRAFAETGVDGISIGDLTHSVKALDIRMRLS
jgi:nicotinate-nucleotide pyrophosphorylase (carboxylating)